MQNQLRHFCSIGMALLLGLLVGWGTLQAQVSVSAPTMVAAPGDLVRIPVSVGNLTNLGVSSVELILSCDTTIVRITGYDLTGTVIDGWLASANYTIAPFGPGKIKISAASSLDATGSGILAYVTGTAQNKTGVTALQIISVTFNTGTPAAVLTSGSLRVNRAPTMTAISAKTVAEKDTLRFTAVATDPDLNDTLSYSLVGGPTGASIVASTGAFTWVPDYGQAGPYSIKIRVVDLGGAKDSTTVSITVTHTNRKPSFVNKMRDTTISDGSLYTFSYSASDPDAGTNLTYKLESGPSGATVSSAGLFSWNPAFSQLGAANVVVSVGDGSLADTAKAKITVIHVNRPPSFVLKLRDTTINEGTTLTFAYSATDPDAGSTIAYNLLNGPSGATVSSTGVLTFTTPSSPAGPFVITVTASDGSLADTAKATVSVNHKPVFGSRTPATVTTISRNVATTFTVVATDPDGNPLTFTWKVNGVAEKTGDNTFTRTFTDGQGVPKSVVAIFADARGLKDSTVWNFTITSIQSDGFIPKDYALGQNYPNPFNPSTTIVFDLPKQSPVRLEVYNVIGVLIRTMLRGEVVGAGRHQIVWDGRDDRGRIVPSGVYIYRISAGDFSASLRMTLLK